MESKHVDITSDERPGSQTMVVSVSQREKGVDHGWPGQHSSEVIDTATVSSDIVRCYLKHLGSSRKKNRRRCLSQELHTLTVSYASS